MWVYGPYGPMEVPVPGPEQVPHQDARLNQGLNPCYTPGYNPYEYPMPYGMYNPFGVPFYGPYGAAPMPPLETEEVTEATMSEAQAYQIPQAEPRLGYRMQVTYNMGAPDAPAEE